MPVKTLSTFVLSVAVRPGQATARCLVVAEAWSWRYSHNNLE